MNYSKTEYTCLQELVLKSRRFLEWKQLVESNGNEILEIKILSVISRRPDTWYSAFLDCHLITPEGNNIKRCIVLRGKGIVVIPVFKCIDDGEIYTVMVQQRYICDGALHLTFPAGNADNDLDESYDLRDLACSEFKEETGIDVSKEELLLISDGIRLNCSITDDLIFVYSFVKECNIEWLKSIDHNKTGQNSDGEYIEVRTIRLEDSLKLHTTSSLIGSTLLKRTYEFLK